MSGRLFATAAFVLVVSSGFAEAGVRGSQFSGTVLDLGDVSPYSVLTDFAASGDAYDETFDGTEYPGTYTETDLVLFSFWSVAYTDSDYQTSGISIFGVITTYLAVQTDGPYRYFGILLYAGPSQLPTP